MSESNNSLPAFYAELNKHGQNGEFDRALRIANKILQEYPAETKALHCKVVCLIQLGDFDQAVETIQNSENLEGVDYEHAYCLYRLQKPEDALSVLNSAQESSYRIKELTAQVLYRLEQYTDCYDCYRDLIKNSSDDYDEERETNLSAVLAGMAVSGEHMDNVPELSEDTYELCYNKACMLLAEGDYEGAIEKLNTAEELCKKMMEDDAMEEEEVEDELAVVRTQIGFANQKLGNKELSLKLYLNVLKSKPSDVAVVAIASNNIVTLNKDQNVFDSKKKMKAATAEGVEGKMTRAQKRAVASNKCLLDYYTGSPSEQALKAAKALEEKYPEALVTATLLSAAIYVKERKISKAVSLLKEFSQKHPDQSVYIGLTLAQLLLMQGEVEEACKCLQKLSDVTYKPGVVSALVTLYQLVGDRESAAKCYENAISFYKKNDPASPYLSVLIAESAEAFFRWGKVKEAASFLEEQRKQRPKDSRIVAQLVAAYGAFDPKKAKQISKDLPPVDESQIDVEALETNAFALGTRYMKKVAVKASGSPATGEKVVVKKLKKKKRKGKLPKDFNPNVDPDPERWLPRRERSTFKKSKKDRRNLNTVGKGSQGAVGNVAELDASNRPTIAPVPTQASPAPAGPRTQRPAAQQKKKKKKGGGKW